MKGNSKGIVIALITIVILGCPLFIFIMFQASLESSREEVEEYAEKIELALAAHDDFDANTSHDHLSNSSPKSPNGLKAVYDFTNGSYVEGTITLRSANLNFAMIEQINADINSATALFDDRYPPRLDLKLYIPQWNTTISYIDKCDAEEFAYLQSKIPHPIGPYSCDRLK